MYGIKFHSTIRYALKRQGVEFREPKDANRLYTVNPHVFDNINNEHAAYWLGFLYADGCVHKRTLMVALKRSDLSHLEKLSEFLESDGPVNKTLNSSGNGKSHKTCRFSITEQHLAERLKSLGIVPRRRKIERIVENVPSPLLRHWIRGLFDGDGSARKSPSIVFSGGYNLMEFVRNSLAEQANANPDISIVRHNKANLHYLYYSGRLVALNVADYMYQGATVWMERKRNVIESWPEPSKQERDDKGRFI